LNEILEGMPNWQVSRRAEGVERWRRERVIDDRPLDEELLRRLDKFRADHGKVPVPRRYRCEDGFRLGARLRACLAREPRRHGLLRRALADSPWPIGASERFRNEGFAHLWEYVRERGTACVPAPYVCEDGFKLGSWVARRRRKRGVDPVLDAKLQSLPGWVWRPREEGYRRRVQRARDAVLAAHLTSELRLRNWVREQQRAARRGTLDPARVKQLREAGLIGVHLHRGEAKGACTRGSGAQLHSRSLGAESPECTAFWPGR